MKFIRAIGDWLNGDTQPPIELRKNSIEEDFAAVSAAQIASEDERYERLLDAEDDLERRVATLAQPHLQIFVRKYHQLVHIDDYGTRDVRRWIGELAYFVDTVIMRDEQAKDLLNLVFSCETKRELYKPQDFLCRKLDYYLVGEQWHLFEHRDFTEHVSAMSGYEYEKFVAAKIEKLGLQVTFTPATGDQGADLLVQSQHDLIAIQCKRSSAPVGNKAVQEASAGKGYYKASTAWVVSDAPFTKAASQLAERLDVRLLHHAELDGWLT